MTLPSGSLFILGSTTNARFTHAVLPVSGKGPGAPDVGVEGDRATCRVEDGYRISLTFRVVHTFLDRKQGACLGKSLWPLATRPS